ncbi:hypothetical protein ymoll0001_24180 [Yersinia mollaretii ATCC 43969]|uniref:Uncharacterized protein n=1 Tax=Yersinia mollaretii (strain ATCC 43969 / DSM 18520 / CIP 103324 / CNY 7263 / WAIP 204) TaxID=349967 RepID=A0ABM9YDR3_YERMW|nr:hypothetical protein ymoll0001_24180 [Yersinia mollaretii ATCC 43969]
MIVIEQRKKYRDCCRIMTLTMRDEKIGSHAFNYQQQIRMSVSNNLI